MSPDAYKEVLDLQSPLIEKVIESKMNEHDQTQVVKLKDGPVVKVSAGGCAHWGLTVSVERLPDGGTGMMPMHRMVWVLETVPGKRDGIKTMLQELLVTAKKVAATEKPSGKKTASYSEACHEGTCTFDWSRHTDMALDLKATYSLPL